MADLSGTITGGLANYYEHVAKELHRWVDPLSSEQFWRNPYPYGNSAAASASLPVRASATPRAKCHHATSTG